MNRSINAQKYLPRATRSLQKHKVKGALPKKGKPIWVALTYDCIVSFTYRNRKKGLKPYKYIN